jgi:hypothetical protein
MVMTRFGKLAAYRGGGKFGDTPLLLLNYLAANLENCDPKVTNSLAADRDVIVRLGMEHPFRRVC